MKFKRLLALAVVSAMIVSMTPAAVFAEETESEPTETSVESSEPEEKESSNPAQETPAEPEEAEPQESEPEDETPAEEVAGEEESEEKTPSQSESVTEKYDASGTENNIKWTLKNGTLTLSGKGNMPDWDYSNRPQWYDHSEEITKVVVGKGIKTVGKSAFENLENAKSVSLPAGITKIDDYAFQNCKLVESVNIPSTVTYIGMYAFNACNKLKKIALPNGLKIIGQCAFRDCRSFESLTIPGSVEVICQYAFCNCLKLKTVTISSGVKELHQNVFDGCCELVTASIPGSVKTINSFTFISCYKLKNLTIGYGVETISDYAFVSTGIESITIPDSVTKLGKEILGSCSELKQINIAEELHLNSPSAWYGVSSTVNVNYLQSNPMTAKGKTAKVKYSKLRKKTRTVAASKVLTLTKGTGPYLYVKVSGKKKITINKTTGRVTVKKKLKRGTYKIKVRVMSTGNATYKASGWKTVTFKIKVK
ncbi:MAG: leucine-rich repeat domain-containing protein [Clostridiales bacterium]|nr:leucine-rich repeat domain-containing protein [Clostridiales bacterium]